MVTNSWFWLLLLLSIYLSGWYPRMRQKCGYPTDGYTKFQSLAYLQHLRWALGRNLSSPRCCRQICNKLTRYSAAPRSTLRIIDQGVLNVKRLNNHSTSLTICWTLNLFSLKNFLLCKCFRRKNLNIRSEFVYLFKRLVWSAINFT